MKSQKTSQHILQLSKRSMHMDESSDAVGMSRWMVSYADFITLLFTFFVVMYSISMVNEGKYKLLSESIRIAFPHSQLINGPTPPALIVAPDLQLPLSNLTLLEKNKLLVDKHTAQLGEQQRKIESRMNKLSDGLNHVLAPMIKQNLVSIFQTKRGVVVDISASTLFRSGEAVLQVNSLDVLRQVAAVLSAEDTPIEVEGHSDDVPISTDQFPSNWELSSARAGSVARNLIENGVLANRLSVVGWAANKPLVPNDSAENRARNRRVTIIVASPNLDWDQK